MDVELYVLGSQKCKGNNAALIPKTAINNSPPALAKGKLSSGKLEERAAMSGILNVP